MANDDNRLSRRLLRPSVRRPERAALKEIYLSIEEPVESVMNNFDRRFSRDVYGEPPDVRQMKSKTAKRSSGSSTSNSKASKVTISRAEPIEELAIEEESINDSAVVVTNEQNVLSEQGYTQISSSTSENAEWNKPTTSEQLGRRSATVPLTHDLIFLTEEDRRWKYEANRKRLEEELAKDPELWIASSAELNVPSQRKSEIDVRNPISEITEAESHVTEDTT